MDADGTMIELQKTTINVSCTESYAFRIVTEILKSFGNTVTLKFKSSGMYITEYNQKQCILMDYYLEEEWLEVYSYDLRDLNGHPVDSYSFKVTSEEFLSGMKGVEGKKAHLIFSFDIASDGTNSGIHIDMTNISGNEFVKTFGFRDPITDSDNIYELEYSGRPTGARLSLIAFCNMITRFKQRRCNVIDYTLKKSGRIYVTGRRGKDIFSANYLDSFARESSKDIVNPDIDDDDSDAHTIKMALGECTWLAKLQRLNPTAIIQVYLRDKLPLVLRMKVASIGYAVYSFRDDPHAK